MKWLIDPIQYFKVAPLLETDACYLGVVVEF